MKRLVRAVRLVRRRRPAYLVYLLTGCLYPRFMLWLFGQLSRAGRRTVALLAAGGLGVLGGALGLSLGWQGAVLSLGALVVAVWLGRWLRETVGWMQMRARAKRLLLQANAEALSFTSWAQWPVNLSFRRKVERYRREHAGEVIVLGRIDNDGRVWSPFGEVPHWINVSQAIFVPRSRYSLDIVLLDDKVLIRKDFRGDWRPFVREWHNLTYLMGDANVPAVYRVDEPRTVLYKNLIVGKNVNDVLVAAGARIHNAQTDDDPELAGLDRESRLWAILKRGTALLPRCFPESFFYKLEAQMDAVHRRGVTGLSLTFGNVIVNEHSDPWLLDFEGAKVYRSTQDVCFLWRRDQDRVQFNKLYARDVMTEKKARDELARVRANGPGWYAPIDFGGGLAVDGFWTVDSGTGRWEFLNHRVMAPLLKDKRVLDLGSNNGIMPLMMLRDGAREVVGLELDPLMVERARVVQRIFEWRDMCKYPFIIHTCDMRAILDADWGAFDLITAFCSLYYLAEEDMTRVVRRAAELAPVMVLQAKTDTRPEAEDNKAEKSSVPFLQALLQANGFPHVEIHAPRGYSRPLLVGKRDSV